MPENKGRGRGYERGKRREKKTIMSQVKRRWRSWGLKKSFACGSSNGYRRSGLFLCSLLFSMSRVDYGGSVG
jgi:hypothetical protein